MNADAFRQFYEYLLSEFFDHFHGDHEPDIRDWLALSSSKHGGLQ
jgi:hypothetical protein